MEKENVLLISISLFLIFLLLGYLVYSNVNNKPVVVDKITTDNNVNDVNSEVKSEVVKSMSYSEAIYSNDIKNCDYVNETNLIQTCKQKLGICKSDDCYYTKALASNDEKSCYLITNESRKLDCTYNVKKSNILNRAINERNISLCIDSLVLDDQSNCVNNYYFSLSKIENNKTYCDKINLEALKNECLK